MATERTARSNATTFKPERAATTTTLTDREAVFIEFLSIFGESLDPAVALRNGHGFCNSARDGQGGRTPDQVLLEDWEVNTEGSGARLFAEQAAEYLCPEAQAAIAAAIAADERAKAPTTTSPPPPTTTLPPIAPATRYSGASDDVVQVSVPTAGVDNAIAVIVYRGASNFAVWSLDGSGNQVDLLVNTIGSYFGAVHVEGPVAMLEITASGPWTIELHDPASADAIGTSFSGQGDQVLRYEGGFATLRLTHDGSSNFAVWYLTMSGERQDLAVNEIGRYSGRVSLDPGPILIAITADGPWTATVE